MFVFSNLATSLDGKIATASRELVHLGTPEDRRQMQVLRKRCDIVLMGASTLRTYRKFCGLIGRKSNGRAARQPANAVLSSALDGISPHWPFFADPGLRRILFVTRPVPLARRRAFERSSEIIQLKPPRRSNPVAFQILNALENRGFQDVLVEGGGGLMWDFASQNLIDEYHVTLTPKIVGGENSPTLVEGLGFKPDEILDLRLARCRKVGDELYLTYKRKKT